MPAEDNSGIDSHQVVEPDVVAADTALPDLASLPWALTLSQRPRARAATTLTPLSGAAPPAPRKANADAWPALFARLVLPRTKGLWYCLAVKARRGMHHQWYATVEALVDGARIVLRSGRDCWFACAG